MTSKNIIQPENDADITYTTLTLEREKIELERERLALERERLSAEREHWKNEAELSPASRGRLSVTPMTIIFASLLCCTIGSLIGILLYRKETMVPMIAPSPAKLELRSITATNEQGDVRSVFVIQPVDNNSGIKRFLLD